MGLPPARRRGVSGGPAGSGGRPSRGHAAGRVQRRERGVRRRVPGPDSAVYRNRGYRGADRRRARAPGARKLADPGGRSRSRGMGTRAGAGADREDSREQVTRMSWTVIGWIAFVVILLLSVMLHEFGHFLTARRFGMKATEFFVGFGPRLWSFRRGETEYGIKAIPAGGYVRIVGMNNLEDVPPEDEARSYRQQSFPKRLVVVLAGPATHFVQAVVLVFLLLAVVG